MTWIENSVKKFVIRGIIDVEIKKKKRWSNSILLLFRCRLRGKIMVEFLLAQAEEKKLSSRQKIASLSFNLLQGSDVLGEGEFFVLIWTVKCSWSLFHRLFSFWLISIELSLYKNFIFMMMRETT